MLRLVYSNVGRRILTETNSSKVLLARRTYKYLEHEQGFTVQEIEDPNINELYTENFHNLLPPEPRLNFTTPEWKALKSKEKGDWKNLTEEDKHLLYRGFFRYSIAEIMQPTDEWKSTTGIVLCFVGLSFLIHWFWHIYVLPPYLKTVTDPELVKKQIKLQLQQHQGIVGGISSHWDYENNRWKE